MTDPLAWAALVGVGAAILQLGSLRKQRRRSFEDFFVERYWKIMDDLSLEAVKGEEAEDKPVSRPDEKAILAYLRLSEDEWDLRAKGWISTSTWNLWSGGMKDQLVRWPFKKVWQHACDREEALGEKGEYRCLRNAQADGFASDPCPRWRRLLHHVYGP